MLVVGRLAIIIYVINCKTFLNSVYKILIGKF